MFAYFFGGWGGGVGWGGRQCAVMSIDKYVRVIGARRVLMDAVFKVGVGVWCVCVGV